MMIVPFSDMTTEELIKNARNQIQNKIDNFTDEEIMSNNIKFLCDNIYQEFYISPVIINDKSPEKKTFKDMILNNQKKKVEGMIIEYHYSFVGEEKLFYCKASSYLVCSYPLIKVNCGEIVFKIQKTIDDIKYKIKPEQIEKEIEKSLDLIKRGIEFANNDIINFNLKIKLEAFKKINEKKSNIEAYFNFAKELEIPIDKKEYVRTDIKIERKINPIKHHYDSENNYSISDLSYKDVLDSIKHTVSTYESTPDSYKSMKEEDLRNTILGALNAIYKGGASGERFRRNGKTDICIEFDNRAAFVAECKMWTGVNEVKNALEQLDSYLTWRDFKTALIYFVRRKDFIKILDKTEEILQKIEKISYVKKIDKNEFDCNYISKSNEGQKVKVRVMLFNLYS